MISAAISTLSLTEHVPQTISYQCGADTCGSVYAHRCSSCGCGLVCSSVEAGNRITSYVEQDSFEDDFTDLGSCVAMYAFDGE